jgi:glycosidase
MKFKQLDKFETNLKTKITELIKLRRNSLSLLYGSTHFIETSKKHLIFKRKYLNETATIIFNLSDKELKYNKLIIKPNDYNITITK